MAYLIHRGIRWYRYGAMGVRGAVHALGLRKDAILHQFSTCQIIRGNDLNIKLSFLIFIFSTTSDKFLLDKQSTSRVHEYLLRFYDDQWSYERANEMHDVVMKLVDEFLPFYNWPNYGWAWSRFKLFCITIITYMFMFWIWFMFWLMAVIDIKCELCWSRVWDLLVFSYMCCCFILTMIFVIQCELCFFISPTSYNNIHLNIHPDFTLCSKSNNILSNDC